MLGLTTISLLPTTPGCWQFPTQPELLFVANTVVEINKNTKIKFFIIPY